MHDDIIVQIGMKVLSVGWQRPVANDLPVLVALRNPLLRCGMKLCEIGFVLMLPVGKLLHLAAVFATRCHREDSHHEQKKVAY